MVPAPTPLALIETVPLPITPTFAYPKEGELNKTPVPFHVSCMAPMAPPSGKLERELNETPFTEPVNAFGAAARMIRSSPKKDLFPINVTLKLLPNTIPTDWPVAPVPRRCTTLGVECEQVKLAKESQLFAVAERTVARNMARDAEQIPKVRMVFLQAFQTGRIGRNMHACCQPNILLAKSGLLKWL
jgi:hypothetical protein